MPKAKPSARTISQTPLTAEKLMAQLKTHKTIGAVRGLKAETQEVLYAQALAKLQQKDYEAALYLFSFLVLHQHPDDAYWQGLGYAQSGLGNYAAAAMSFLAGYALKPSAALALELAKSFNDCGMASLASHYAATAKDLADKAGEQLIAGRAALLESCLSEVS